MKQLQLVVVFTFVWASKRNIMDKLYGNNEIDFSHLIRVDFLCKKYITYYIYLDNICDIIDVSKVIR